VWSKDLIQTAPPSPSAPTATNPVQCSISGHDVKTSPKQPWIYFANTFGYDSNVSVHITYNTDATYHSRLIYTGNPACTSEWVGGFTYGTRYETYPNVTTYPYSAAGSQTVFPSSTSFCNSSFLYDPAACIFETVSSPSVTDCLIEWNNYVRGSAPCHEFKIMYTPSNPYVSAGPTLFIQQPTSAPASSPVTSLTPTPPGATTKPVGTTPKPVVTTPTTKPANLASTGTTTPPQTTTKSLAGGIQVAIGFLSVFAVSALLL